MVNRPLLRMTMELVGVQFIEQNGGSAGVRSEEPQPERL